MLLTVDQATLTVVLIRLYEIPRTQLLTTKFKRAM